MNYKHIWLLFRRAFVDWNAHEAPRLGAALAFYTILSLAPLVILVIAMAGVVFGRSSAQHQFLDQVENMVGRPGSEAIKGMLEHAQESGVGKSASIIGFATLLFGASGVFGELRSALNKIWDIQIQSQDGFWGTLKQRIFSFGIVLGVGFLLLISLIISAALSAVTTFFGNIVPLPDFVLVAINFWISLAGVAVLFGLIFRYVPDTKIPWRQVAIGATVTAFLFTIGKFLIGLYLGEAAVGSAYGAAGSLIVFLVWIYYSALIFFFGAEFTHALDQRRISENLP